MDSWSDREMKIMTLGGNAKFNKFQLKQGFSPNMNMSTKYNALAMRLYREWMKKRLKGETTEEPDSIPMVGLVEDDPYAQSAQPAPYKPKSKTKSKPKKAHKSKSSRHDSRSGSSSHKARDHSPIPHLVVGEGNRLGKPTQYQGFGSSGESSTLGNNGGDDFWGSVTSSFFSGLETAKSASKVVAEKTKVAAVGLGQASKNALDDETWNSVKQTTDKGWGLVSSFVNTTVQTVNSAVNANGETAGPDGLSDFLGKAKATGDYTEGKNKYESYGNPAFKAPKKSKPKVDGDDFENWFSNSATPAKKKAKKSKKAKTKKPKPSTASGDLDEEDLEGFFDDDAPPAATAAVVTPAKKKKTSSRDKRADSATKAMQESNGWEDMDNELDSFFDETMEEDEEGEQQPGQAPAAKQQQQQQKKNGEAAKPGKGDNFDNWNFFD
jgi:hypothetical protein